MVIILFTVLNGLGVIFLVYVLVQFWKEGHRPMKPATRDKAVEFPVKDSPTVLVVTHPISGGLRVEPPSASQGAHAGFSVISMQTRTSTLQERQLQRDSANGADEMSLNRFFAR